LGELSENNTNSWFRKNESGTTSDPTANCVLQVLLNKDDKQLWNEMDQATFEAIEAMAGEGNKVEWWHQPQPKNGGALPPGVWKEDRPGQDTIRMPGIVHEASLIPLGNGNDSPVDENYKVKGVSNVVCSNRHRQQFQSNFCFVDIVCNWGSYFPHLWLLVRSKIVLLILLIVTHCVV
jgi:hypothetical protein